jgi:hypothetical protein
MSYHNKIMNIKDLSEKHPNGLSDTRRMYKLGHRDARHAAAEIVIEADLIIEEQQRKIGLLEAELARAKAVFEGAMEMWKHDEEEMNAELERLHNALVIILASIELPEDLAQIAHKALAGGGGE